MKTSTVSVGALILAAILSVIIAFAWGALFTWAVDEHIGNILGREVAFTDVWIVSSLSLVFFSSIVNRGSA